MTEIKARKKAIFDAYENYLCDKHVKLDRLPQVDPCYWFVSVLVEDANDLSEYLKNLGIQSRRAFPPLSMQPCYKGSKQIKFNPDPNACGLYGRYLSLPSSATLSHEHILNICKALNEYKS